MALVLSGQHRHLRKSSGPHNSLDTQHRKYLLQAHYSYINFLIIRFTYDQGRCCLRRIIALKQKRRGSESLIEHSDIVMCSHEVDLTSGMRSKPALFPSFAIIEINVKENRRLRMLFPKSPRGRCTEAEASAANGQSLLDPARRNAGRHLLRIKWHFNYGQKWCCVKERRPLQGAVQRRRPVQHAAHVINLITPLFIPWLQAQLHYTNTPWKSRIRDKDVQYF